MVSAPTVGGRPEARRHDVAHDDLLDVARIDRGATDRLFDDEGAELGRGEGLEPSEKPAGGRANRGNDDR
jgi:hypothetical protein